MLIIFKNIIIIMVTSDDVFLLKELERNYKSSSGYKMTQTSARKSFYNSNEA